MDQNLLIQQLADHKRTAWIPETSETIPAFSDHSKFGGYPYLRNENDWPLCPNCNSHLQLILQLNLTELPTQPDHRRPHLIQLFYCTNSEDECEITCEGWEAFSSVSCCRRINIQGPSIEIEANLLELFPERRIVAWTEREDYPSIEEYEELGLDPQTAYAGLPDEYYPIAVDKLCGWPSWEQSPEYPNDRQTGARMDLLFQLSSNRNIPWMWGDAGIGHLTQSPNDPNELAFAWACA